MARLFCIFSIVLVIIISLSLSLSQRPARSEARLPDFVLFPQIPDFAKITQPKISHNSLILGAFPCSVRQEQAPLYFSQTAQWRVFPRFPPTQNISPPLPHLFFANYLIRLGF
jgi:hypothetical protein